MMLASEVALQANENRLQFLDALGRATAPLADADSVLAVTTRIDGLWRILRRAAGHDQKEGIIGRLWMWTAVVAGGAFGFWFIIINGPGSTMMPGS